METMGSEGALRVRNSMLTPWQLCGQGRLLWWGGVHAKAWGMGKDLSLEECGKRMLRRNSREGRGSQTWEQKGVTQLKVSMDWRKHSIRLRRGASSLKDFWATAKSWILSHEYQETIGVFCSGRGLKTVIENISFCMPKSFLELKSEFKWWIMILQ